MAAEPPACGLLGKLVGDLVAVVAMEIADEGVRIDDVVVAGHLRRKRIGRFMLDEAARIARKVEREMLIVEAPGEARERAKKEETAFVVFFQLD